MLPISHFLKSYFLVSRSSNLFYFILNFGIRISSNINIILLGNKNSRTASQFCLLKSGGDPTIEKRVICTNKSQKYNLNKNLYCNPNNFFFPSPPLLIYLYTSQWDQSSHQPEGSTVLCFTRSATYNFLKEEEIPILLLSRPRFSKKKHAPLLHTLLFSQGSQDLGNV